MLDARSRKRRFDATPPARSVGLLAPPVAAPLWLLLASPAVGAPAGPGDAAPTRFTMPIAAVLIGRTRWPSSLPPPCSSTCPGR